MVPPVYARVALTVDSQRCSGDAQLVERASKLSLGIWSRSRMQAPGSYCKHAVPRL